MACIYIHSKQELADHLNIDVNELNDFRDTVYQWAIESINMFKSCIQDEPEAMLDEIVAMPCFGNALTSNELLVYQNGRLDCDNRVVLMDGITHEMEDILFDIRQTFNYINYANADYGIYVPSLTADELVRHFWKAALGGYERVGWMEDDKNFKFFVCAFEQFNNIQLTDEVLTEIRNTMSQLYVMD